MIASVTESENQSNRGTWSPFEWLYLRGFSKWLAADNKLAISCRAPRTARDRSYIPAGVHNRSVIYGSGRISFRLNASVRLSPPAPYGSLTLMNVEVEEDNQGWLDISGRAYFWFN
jgi:hypothetical protein